MRPASPYEAKRLGIAYCSSDRKHDGLFLGLPVMVNLTSPALLIKSQSDPKSLYAVYEGNVNRIREKFSKSVTAANIDYYTNE